MTAHSAAHLTKEELTDNLLGVQSLTVNAHLLSCPACADEVQRMKSSIGDFRDAAHAWSEDLAATNRLERVTDLLPSLWPARWVLVLAAMVLLAVGFLTHFRQRQTASQSSPAQVSTPMVRGTLSQAQLDRDNQLLSQVSGELSEAVPAPMQPLLVSESSATNAVANK